MKQSILILITFFSLSAFSAQRNLIAVGQGIVSPSLTNNLIISNGYTSENPTGLAYLNGIRLTGELDVADSSSSSNDGYGAEFGFGNGTMGLAIGYYQADCNTCDEDIYAGFGVLLGDAVGFGLSADKELYSTGVIINPTGRFRLGLTAMLYDPDGDNNNVTSFGAGVAYYGEAWNFTVDASKYEAENSLLKVDTVRVTPGLAMHVDAIYLSVNLDTYVNEPTGVETDNDLWVGLGYGHGDPFNITLYSDYYNEWTLTASMFF